MQTTDLFFFAPIFYKVTILLIIFLRGYDIIQKEDKGKFYIYGIFVDLFKFFPVAK